jgi:hypothetical protein
MTRKLHLLRPRHYIVDRPFLNVDAIWQPQPMAYHFHRVPRQLLPGCRRFWDRPCIASLPL